VVFVRRESTKTDSKIDTPELKKPQLTSFLVSPNELNGALLTQAHDESKNTYNMVFDGDEKDLQAQVSGKADQATKVPVLEHLMSLKPSRIVPVCATWFMPNDAKKRTGLGSFTAIRIPGARFLDIDEACDKSSRYPHMLPTAPDFARAMSQLGIRPTDRVVCYDDAEVGIFSAPRAAWMFKVFGHRRVHILNNFKLWVDKGFPVEKGEPLPSVKETEYPVPTLDRLKVMHYEDLVDNLCQNNDVPAMPELNIVDARSRGRWEGTEPEPRPGKFILHLHANLTDLGLLNGHIPFSISIPFSGVLNDQTKAFMSPNELRVYLEIKGVDPKKPVVTTCGTGVTACILDAALTAAGYPEKDRKVYDGSWTEWATRQVHAKGMIRYSKPDSDD
jgi:thiosulfate/3-mercaptopyruvate sulfurtransferase